MRSLDVALVAHNVVRRDGQGRVMLELARALVKDGHRVTVYARRLTDELRPGVDYHRLPKAPGPQLLDDLFLFLLGSLFLHRRRHDVTVVMGACALPPRPFVLDCQFSHAGWRRSWARTTRPAWYHRLHARMIERLENLVARRATRVVASTGVVKRDLGGPAHKISVVPNGIDLDEFPPVSSEARARAREELGIRDANSVVAFLGEYHTTRKGLDPLLEAVAAGPSDERLVVAARGSRSRLETRLHDLGIRDRVDVVGFAEPALVMAAADIVAVPSIYEPFSLVALEAAASQIPVIVSAAAGAASLLAPDVVVIDDPTEPDQLRRALDTVRTDPDTAAGRARRARRKVEELRWHELAARAAEVVVEAANEGVRPIGIGETT